MSKLECQINKEGRFIIFIELVKIDFKTNRVTLLKKCHALIDTGANISTISKDVVEELALKPISRQNVKTASGTMDAGVFDINIAIPQLSSPKINNEGNIFQGGEKVIRNIKAVEFVGGEEQMLLGMDILSESTIVINNGVLTLCLH